MQFTLSYSSLSISPFEIQNSFKARILFDWIEPIDIPYNLEPNTERAYQRVQLV
jgi:hypothetical protein